MQSLLLLLAFLIAENSWSQAVAIEPGVSANLAEQRAKSLKNIHYQLFLDIPEDKTGPIAGHVVIEFDLVDNQLPLQLDFQAKPGQIHSVKAGTGMINYDFKKEHLIISPGELATGRNKLEIKFTAGDSSLNRNPEYLYSLFVPDRARTAFPLFDQPDLKARYQLSLQVPSDWEAISNAPLKEKKSNERGALYIFETSDLTSSYLFSFVTGKFQRITREMDGRNISLLHRETDKEKVARNLDAIFTLHNDAIEWMENYTGLPYPFAKFDFALIPSFQYGGMEHPGAIQYRASSLLLDESPTQSQLLNRAGLIAHETAHMWFGNLVTMKWFNDVWTKEVFANFMAAKIVNPAFPDVQHDLNFLMRHYPGAYSVDRSKGSNPIRQNLTNLNQAGQMYGPIIYLKAPIMMRQLELTVSEPKFRAGLQQYLKDFAFANATWPDLIAILDARSTTDLEAWSKVWVNTTGRPNFQTTANDRQQTELIQQDPEKLGRIWPQQFSAAFVSGDKLITSNKEKTPITGQPMQLNSDGLGYGLFPVQAQRLINQNNLDELARGALLIDAWENFLNKDNLAASEYLKILLARISVEDNALVLEQALSQLYRLHSSFLTPAERANAQESVESLLRKQLESAEDPGRSRLFFNALREITTTTQGLVYLQEIWSGKKALETVPLSETDSIHLAEILALRQPQESKNILASQRKQIKNPDLLRRFDYVAPVLSVDTKVRDRFFKSLEKPENRTTERWVLDALGYLHHPARVEQSEKYILPSLELLEEVQVTGDIFFPSGWLNATLRNQRSQTAVNVVHQFLEQRPDYNPQLRMKILQAVDMAERASR